MSELAIIHLRQARSFARAGDANKAVELLEKARVLSRGDAELQAKVLDQLAESYDAVGRLEQAARCREQRSRLGVSSPIMAPPPLAYPVRRTSRGNGRYLLAGAAAAILLGGITAMIFWNHSRTPTYTIVVRPESPSIRSITVGPAAPKPPRHPVRPAPPVIAVGAPDPHAAIPTVPELPPPPKPDRQEVLKETVGLIVVVVHYEGPTNQGNVKIDLPLATGTTFAVTASGIMLTNRHVTEAAIEAKVPISLEKAHLPTVTLRDTTYVICFGSDPKDRHVAKLLHKSEQFDLAVLKIDRHFDRPLSFATRELRQGDDILVCGYPGAVMAAMNQASTTPARIVDVSRKWQSTRHVDAFDEFSPESFNSTLTKGIVSAPERNVKGVGYMQIDAVISPGNSGGPVLNVDNQVVGIATWGLRSSNGESTTASYNFALLVAQLQSDLQPYTKD